MLEHKMAMENTTGSVLRQARKQRKLSLRAVGEAAGVSAQAVGNWEANSNDITMDNLRKVSGFLGIDADAATRGALVWREVRQDITEGQRISNIGIPDLGPRDIELLGQAVGGADADFRFNGQVVEYLRRPAGIANLRGVFATQVLGVSMIPRFEPGEVIYAGGRQPVPGDYVIIEMFPAEGETAGNCFIKRFLSRTPAEIICHQFNPDCDLKFNAYEIKQMSRVIPWGELLGY